MKTTKDYRVNFMGYGDIIVPKGTVTTHQTACGIDENYNFVNEYGWIARDYPTIKNILIHDVKYHGINVPKEYLQ